MDVLNETPLQPAWVILPQPGRSFAAAFAIKGTYVLQPGGPAIPAEAPDALEGDVPEAEGSTALKYTRDLTAPKPSIDLLFSAEAFAPGAKPVDMMPVTAIVGGWSKTLAVLGDRRKTKGLLFSKVLPPATFARMPLTWSRAYGGVEYPRNPEGRGRDEAVEAKGEVYLRLPNVVRLNEAGLDAGALKEPAGFGPISPDWESRAEIPRRAHYGAQWLKERWPAPPEDFDPDFFCAAPPDQRLPLGTLRGNEAVEFHNLHPARARYTSALPGLRPRLFLEEDDPAKKDGPPVFREIPLRIDTLWADPAADKLILVWRGFTPIRSKKLKEVTALIIAQEPMSKEPAPTETYRALLAAKRAEREKAQQAPPPAPPVFEPLEIAPIDADMAALEKELAQPPSMELSAEEAAVYKEVEAETRGATAAALAEEKLPTAIVHTTPPGDPASMAAQMLKDHQAIAAVNPKAARLLTQPLPAESFDAEALIKKEMAEFEKDFAKPLFAPGAAPPGGEEGAADDEKEGPDPDEWTRERVVAHAAEKQPFLNADMEGLDLSTLDLSGAVFEDCVLAACSLKGAVLTAAVFRRCSFTGAVLTGAALGGTQFSFCDLVEADLSDVALDKTALDDSDCSKAKFDRSRWTSVSARRAGFGGASFTEAQIRECNFSGADFEAAVLNKVALGKSDFRSVNAYGIKASECDFEGCELGNFRAGDGATFVNTIFRGCKGAESVWEGAVLDRANFSFADLRRANFSGASLQEAKFGQAKLAKARFPEANLTKAELQKADLFRATFEGATVDGADFRLSNAYEAEFLDTTGSGARFDEANLKGTKLA